MRHAASSKIFPYTIVFSWEPVRLYRYLDLVLLLELMPECKVGGSVVFTTQVPVVTPPIVDFLLSRMVVIRVDLLECSRRACTLLS